MKQVRSVAFHTLGCKVNQVETEQMIEQFYRQGYQVVDFGDPADIYVINTCTVTHISDRKSRAMLRRAIRNNPQALVVATGCVAQVARAQLAEIEGIGLIVGNPDKERLVELVENYGAAGPADQPGCTARFCSPSQLQPTLYAEPHHRTRGFIKIQDGCQSFCSYCIVPLARGPLRSKTAEDVKAEFGHMLDLGYKEIVLTGIHTGLYGIDLPGWDLDRLLGYLLTIKDKDYRIRLSSIEPGEWHDGLLQHIAGESRICPHFHIPLQSGSDRILASMRRRYTRDQYRRLLLGIAELIPRAVFTADVMVGYPTETNSDFQDTYDLLAELPIFELHVFKYSPRAGTAAAKMDPQVEAQVKQKRSDLLLQLGKDKKQSFLQGQVGQELTVLVERHLSEDCYAALSDNYIEVHFSSALDLVGKLVKTRVMAIDKDHVHGILTSPA